MVSHRALLFLIHINDLVNSTQFGQFVLFADDTNIFVVGKDENEVYSKANIVLGKVCEYLYENQLHINKGKHALCTQGNILKSIINTFSYNFMIK